MNKKAYLVFGPESSGNRMMARSFDTSGVLSVYSKNGVYISGPHKPIYTESPLLIVMSLPYNRHWPNIVKIYQRVESEKFNDIYLIFLDRKTHFLANSQKFQGRVGSIERAYENIAIARQHIDSAIKSLDVKTFKIQYEDFVTDKEYREKLFKELGLPAPTLEYYNANEDRRYKCYQYINRI